MGMSLSRFKSNSSYMDGEECQLVELIRPSGTRAYHYVSLLSQILKTSEVKEVRRVRLKPFHRFASTMAG